MHEADGSGESRLRKRITGRMLLPQPSEDPIGSPPDARICRGAAGLPPDCGADGGASELT